jgi:hypothetical protein
MASLASSDALSSATKRELLAMDSQVNSLSSLGSGNQRWKPSLPEQVKFTGTLFKGGIRPAVAKVIGGLALSSGVMSAAQAAEVDEKLDQAADAIFLPMAVIHHKELGGGDCGMELPSPYFALDKDRSCNYNFEWNERIQARVLLAQEAELPEIFKERGVCDAINKNFERFYPKPKGAVNCSSSPLRVEVADGASFTINDDYVSIIGAKGQTVGFYPGRSGSGHFSISGKRTKESLSFQQLATDYPEEFAEFNRLKAVALSVQSCCNQQGTLPPEKECQRYGIQTGEGPNNQRSTSDSGSI